MTLQEIKANPVVKEMVEVRYRKEAIDLLKKMWGTILKGEDISINQSELGLLVDDMVEKYYIALDFVFDDMERLVKYCTVFEEFRQEMEMTKALTEKSTQDLIPEERIMKIFSLN